MTVKNKKPLVSDRTQGANIKAVTKNDTIMNALAEVSLTTPLKYLSLVFAIVFGFYFFNESPTIYTLSGASLIVVSSAIIFIREHQLKKPITLPRQQ